MSFLDQLKFMARNFFKTDTEIAAERKAMLNTIAADPKLQAIKESLVPNSTEDTKLEIASATSVADLKQCISNIITCNEMQLREIERNLIKIEKEGTEETDKVKAGGLTEGEKMRALRRIKRLGNRHKSMTQRVGVYQENINLHTNLIDKIREMAAMDLKGINPEQIEELEFDYEEIQEKHRELVVSEKALFKAETTSDINNAKEQEELKELEKAILGEVQNTETSSKQESEVIATPEPKSKKPRRTNRKNKKLVEE